jgi:phosphatidylinositol-3-phosphatase
MPRKLRPLILALCLPLALAAPGATSTALATPPPIHHVFIVMLENENATSTFGPDSPAPYLSKTLRSKGAFLPNYYAVTHLSLGNYLGLLSGQGSNPQTQADCQVFNQFVRVGTGSDGQALGQGCVYPSSVQTLANQLTAHGLTWKGYMEDMGNDPARESATCGHPPIGSPDPTQNAEVGDQYAARHNPFVYFHSIIDTPACNARDVPLTRLPEDIANFRVSSLSFITPNLCHDGHDEPCVDGEPGGLVSADAWLREWVPTIMKSAAYRRDGLLLITFDEAEAEGDAADASACCNEAQFPNTPNNGGPVEGRGGGRVGAVALSPFIKPATTSLNPYNHFSTLRTIERLFGLPFLGYARSPNPGSFGGDVFAGYTR